MLDIQQERLAGDSSSSTVEGPVLVAPLTTCNLYTHYSIYTPRTGYGCHTSKNNSNKADCSEGRSDTASAPPAPNLVHLPGAPHSPSWQQSDARTLPSIAINDAPDLEAARTEHCCREGPGGSSISRCQMQH